ncbi:NAD-dependent epimerase/dehydratase family protein [Actibacterium pelagium]|uniref:NAD-dependent epimerase/dehydratase family protein n=1 Tax=Actibacterium pelagium TaxID=2029103 RepID=UPI00130442FA|nr:NAD(P)-dependent oxidoreductase [Actibacterium pelagium]
MTRILITGASGRVARLIAPFLTRDPDLQIRWQSRRSQALHRDWVCCDPLRDWGRFLAACRGCDAIWHLAGVTPAAKAPEYSVNTRLSRAVLRAAQQASVPVMLAMSSVAVYGRSDQAFAEDSPTNPEGAYGQSKLEMEQALRQADGRPTQLRLLRVGNVLGADALMQGQPRPTWLDQFPDGRTPVRSYIAPVSLARVMKKLSEPALDHDIWNVAASDALEMADLLRAAGLRWSQAPAPANALPNAILDTTRLQKFMGRVDQPTSAADMVTEWQAQSLQSVVA